MYKTFEAAEIEYYGYWYNENPDKEKAVEIALEAYQNFHEHKHQILLDLIVFYSDLNHTIKCKEMLNEGFSLGYWYPKAYIPKVFEQDVYKEEVMKWEGLKAASLKTARVLYEVDLPIDYDENEHYPLCMSLHGFGENITLFKRFWQSDLIKKDFIHVYIQSSQMIGSNHYTWTNETIAHKDVYAVLKEVQSKFLTEDFNIIGGFSEGGTTAMALAFLDQATFNGFISLNPSRPQTLGAHQLVNTTLRGGIITGDLDKAYDEQVELMATFKKAKFPCAFKVNQNFGHWFPENLGQLMDEIIEFISYGNMNYSQLLNVTMELYEKEQYAFAYEFISKYSENIICNDAQIYNFRYSIACKMGKPTLGMAILKEAVHEQGYWYAAEYLQSDEDLNALRDLEDFKAVLKLCESRERASKAHDPNLFVCDMRDGKRSDLFMALHGDQENYRVIKDHWPVKDVVLAFAESSQEEFSNGFVWTDIDRGIGEIANHLEVLHGNYPIETTTIAAFSSGASVLLEALTTDAIAVDRIILLAPWLPNLDGIIEDLRFIKDKKIKVFMACGDQDEDCFETSKKLSDAFDELNMPYEFVILEGLSHEYPNDMTSLLHYAFDYFEHKRHE